MCCIIFNLGRSAHTYIYLKLEIFYQYNVYENSRVHCNVMREQSSETMNPGPILIHRNTKQLSQIALYFSDLFNSEKTKNYLPFSIPI